MKPLKSLIILVGALVVAGITSVQAENVILTVSVNSAAEQYYKVQDFMKDMQENQKQVEEKATSIQEEGQALALEFKELYEQAQSEILTEDARKEAMTDAQAKQQEVAGKQQELQTLIENARNSMAAREQSSMQIFTKEITDVINEIASERKATVVFDVSGASRNGLPTVIYSDSAIDITAEVVTIINADKPAEEAEAE